VDITLIGGGWDVAAQTRCLSPFLAAATARADAPPTIAFVWVDEQDGTNWGERWMTLLREVGEHRALDVPVPIGGALDPSRLTGGAADALFVCGGLTPAYADVLRPAADTIRRLVLDDGLPYAGSSAGAAVAARHAVVGGYLDGGRVVCPGDAGEDLEDVTVVDGLGLVDVMVDVHASAWGTLPRLAAALRQAPDGTTGVALDEDTAWHVTGATAPEVLGANAVHELSVQDDHTTVWVTRRASTVSAAS
jgi:cyanophycinase